MGLVKNAYKGLETILKSNKPIDSIYTGMKNGLQSVADDIDDIFVARMKDQYIKKAENALNTSYQYGTKEQQAAHKTASEAMKKINGIESFDASDYMKAVTHDINGNFSYKRTAVAGLGLYAGGDAGVRLATGGGLYRNADGEFDIVGVPGL